MGGSPLPWAPGLPVEGVDCEKGAFAPVILGCRLATVLDRAEMELLIAVSSEWI
jgi:hypothetical protein